MQLKRHSIKHNRTECRYLTANNYHQVKQNIQNQPRSSRIETKAYQADPSNMNSYVLEVNLASYYTLVYIERSVVLVLRYNATETKCKTKYDTTICNDDLHSVYRSTD